MRAQTTDGLVRRGHRSTRFNDAAVSSSLESFAPSLAASEMSSSLPAAIFPQSDQQSPMIDSSNEESAVSDESELAAPGSSHLRPIWRKALNLCRSADEDREGSLRRADFIAALVSSDPGQHLSEEEKHALADKFTIDGSNRIDYVSCFRAFLTNWTAESSSKTVDRVQTAQFTSYNHMHRKEARPMHPWEFEYRREPTLFNPYIPHSNTKVKRTVLDHVRAKTFPLLIHPKNDSDLASVLLKYDAKAVAVCKKCAEAVNELEVKYLEHEFRSCEGRAQRTGFIPPESFQSVLRSYCKSLSSGEMGTLLRVFRSSLKEKDINYDAFLHVCSTMRPKAKYT